jgi:hypothetical protein
MLDFRDINRLRVFPYRGFICNAIALVAITVLGFAVFIAGLKPWGGIVNSAGWAGFIFGLLFILWFVLARISGVANMVIMILICWAGFTGKDGALHHTANISNAAEFIRADREHSSEIVAELGGFGKYDGDEGDVDLVQAYRHEMERSWVYYGTFVNPWYTKERFTEAWQNFFTWFSDHKWPEDGLPPEMPYMGTEDQIKRWQTDYAYSPNDHHHGDRRQVALVPAPPSKQQLKDEWEMENGATQMEREAAYRRLNHNVFPYDWRLADKAKHPEDYNGVDPKVGWRY